MLIVCKRETGDTMEFEDIQNRLTARLPEQLENQKVSYLLRKSIQPYKEGKKRVAG